MGVSFYILLLYFGKIYDYLIFRKVVRRGEGKDDIISDAVPLTSQV